MAQDDEIRKRWLALPGAAVGASDPSAGLDCAGHRAAFAEFLAALEQGSTPPVDGVEARKAVATIVAIYRSARAGGVPVEPQ